jgi:hypothetical protein
MSVKMSELIDEFIMANDQNLKRVEQENPPLKDAIMNILDYIKVKYPDKEIEGVLAMPEVFAEVVNEQEQEQSFDDIISSLELLKSQGIPISSDDYQWIEDSLETAANVLQDQESIDLLERIQALKN